MLVLFLAPDDRLVGWWEAEAGEVIARGGPADTLPDIVPDAVIAVAPAEAVAIHRAELGNLASAQARTAARLLLAENSLAPIETQHVAVGQPEGADRMIAAVGNGRIEAWLEALQAHGFDPDAIVPAPLLLPSPDEGFVRAPVGEEIVLRGRSSGFAEDPALTPLLVGDAPVADLADPEATILAAIADPELDLRQGPFARRRRFQIDWPLARRLGWLGVATVAVILLIAIVQIARYSFAANTLELRARDVAARAVPAGTADPVAALDAKLASLRGGGLGFTAMAGALFAAVQATPNVELAGLDFDSNGLLRATVIAAGAADADALRARIAAAGLAVDASTFASSGGRIRGELRITPK